MNDDKVNKTIAKYMDVGCSKIGNKYRGCNWNSGPGDTCDSCTEAVFGNLDYFSYTKSIDTLTPVWEKLCLDIEVTYNFDGYAPNDKWHCSIEIPRINEVGKPTNPHIYQSNWQKTIQQAAAYATAKAIKEFKK